MVHVFPSECGFTGSKTSPTGMRRIADVTNLLCGAMMVGRYDSRAIDLMDDCANLFRKSERDNCNPGARSKLGTPVASVTLDVFWWPCCAMRSLLMVQADFP